MFAREATAGAGVDLEAVTLLWRGRGADVGTRAEARVDERRAGFDGTVGGAGIGSGGDDWAGDGVGRCGFDGLGGEEAQRLLVQVEALRLVDGIAVPVEAEPGEIVHNPPVGVRQYAWGIDVLDTQQHACPVRP